MSTLSVQSAPSPKPALSDAPPSGLWVRLTSPRGELYSAILAGVLLLASLIARWVIDGDGGREAALVLAWVSLAIGLFHGARAAWESLAQLTFDIDVLMVIGGVLAAVMGAPGEGALLLFLFVLSGALEALAMQRTTRAVEALHKLMPTKAHRLRPGADPASAAESDWEWVQPEQLAPGDVVRVPPGETIPADAKVLSDNGDEGGWAVNQASLTGESLPRTLHAADDVYAGTINVGNPLRIRVSRPVSESSLQRVLNLVIEAQQQREPVQRLIDRFSQPYAISVILFSIVVFFVWWLGFGAPVWATPSFSSAAAESDTRTEVGALYVAITLLIVASPCAVIISTPTATLAAISRAARMGVLFKGGQAIERLSRLQAICFDKTGTLTVGRPSVSQIHAVGWSDEESLLSVAAGLEQESTHPIADAIRRAATERGVTPAPGTQHEFVPGRGVQAVIAGKPARLGTLKHTHDLIPVCFRNKVQEVLQSVQERGNIAVVVVHDQQAAVVVLSDIVRPGAERLVSRLHQIGVRPVVMLTGDNEHTAAAVAKKLDIDLFFSQLLPEDKVHHVERIKSGQTASDEPDAAPDARRFTGVIGDGVNDAPALAASDVSIGIGSIGSDAALETADIVLLNDDLGVVPWAVGLARRARRTILFNLTLAVSAMVVMAIWTLVGSRTGAPLPLWAGVLGHEGGTLVVVLNSLLLLAYPSGAGVASLDSGSGNSD